MSSESLDKRLVPSIDYTRCDDANFALLDILKYPISLDISENMVIFNDQLYCNDTFENHNYTENACNRCLLARGYTCTDSHMLKVPWSDENINYTCVL